MVLSPASSVQAVTTIYASSINIDHKAIKDQASAPAMAKNRSSKFHHYRGRCILTANKCLAVGGRGGFRNATSVRLQPGTVGAARGGSGGEGRFIGDSYRGG